MIFLIPWWLAILWTYTEIVPRPFDDWKNALFYVGAGILTICAIWQTKSTGKPRDRTRFIIAIILLYFTIAIISIIMAPTARYEGLLALARLILWLGAAWVFAQLSSRQWIWLMRITVISATIIAGITWLQSHNLIAWPYGGIFLAPIGHITYYGDFMALSLVMAIGLFAHIWTAPSPRPSPYGRGGIWIICMLLIGMGLALSATRASLLGIVAASLLAIPLAYRSLSSQSSPLKRGGAQHAGVITLILALNLAVIFFLPITSMRGESVGNRIMQSITQSAKLTQGHLDIASSGRWHTYITSAHIAMERPVLGWGLGSFRFVYPEFAHRKDRDTIVSSATWYMHPHNEILHQAVEVGWLGAALFVFGFVYLLYRGVRSLRHSRPEPQIMLITAMCGLVAAFVSWQFSTNFLFPVSRLMTALFAGMLWKLSSHPSTALSNSPLPPLILRGGVIITALSTLLILTNQASIYCVQKEQTARDVRAQQEWATWAVRLAPGAFDPLYIRATVALQTMPPVQAAPDVEALYANYPYVPAVLHMMGYLRAQEGNIPEARKLLQHALANDPANTAAKQLLDQLPPAH